MKKFYLSLILAVLSAVLFSCQKKAEVADVPVGGKVSVKAYCVSQMKGGQKTSIADASKGSVVWSAGDDIKVFNNLGAGSVLTLESGAGTSSAVFTGEVEKGSSGAYVSVCPSQLGASCSGSVISMTLPADQTYVAGSYDSNFCPFVASSTLDGESLNFSFKPAVGLVRFGLRGEGSVTRLVLTDKAGKVLSGTFTVDASAASPVAVAGEGSAIVNLICQSPVVLSTTTDTEFYFALPVGALQNGFTLLVFNNLNEVAKVETSLVNTITVSDLKSFDNVNLIFNSGVALTEDGVLFQSLTSAVNHLSDVNLSGLTLLADVENEDLIVSRRILFDGGGHRIGNMVINDTGNLFISGDVIVSKNFGLEVSPDTWGQMQETGGFISVEGKSYIDKKLVNSGSSDPNLWYHFCIPFPFDTYDDVYVVKDGIESKATPWNEYAMGLFDGSLSWKWFSKCVIQPGFCFSFGTDGSSTYRFYKRTDASLVTENKYFILQDFPHSEPDISGWNNLGNSQFYNVSVSCESTKGGYYNNNNFYHINPNETILGVTSPLFIKQESGYNPYVYLSRYE